MTNTVIRAAIESRRLPWIRPLVDAYANNFSSVASLFAGNPATSSAWKETIARVTKAEHNRAGLSSALGQQLAHRDSPAAARTAAAKLADPAAVAVVTGQQAGLFGGPLYTLLKAITAIQLAQKLEREHHIPAVPVFWVECEDHDWDEVKATEILDAELSPRSVTLADLPGAGVKPVALLELDEHIGAPLEALAGGLPPSEFQAEMLDALKRAYQSGVTMSGAFARWLDRLLGEHGLVVYEANDPALKPLAAELFAHEIRQPDRSADLIREGGERMTKVGHTPQLEPAADGTLLFYLGGAVRTPIRRRDDGFAIGDRVVRGDALLAEAEAHPERFSPNVSLRPIVQDHIFPTVCYVAGPAELAYQAQIAPLYQAFKVEPPLLYSRVSATLLDSAAWKFLEKSGLSLESLQPQDDTELNRLLASLMPPAIDEGLAATSRDVTDRLATLREAVPSVDPTLAGTVDTTRDKMLETLKTLHSKIVQAAKRKDDTLRRQFQRSRALAFPGGHPQERSVSVTFFLNRYGFGLIDQLIEGLPLETDKHYVVVI